MAIKRIFSPPVFEDEEKNRIARLVYIILWTVIGLLTGLVLYKLIVQGESFTSLSTIANFTLVLLTAGLVVVIRLGYVKTASLLLIVLGWLNLTYQAWFNGGLRDAAFIAYIVIILLANLLLGWQAGLVVAGVSIAAGWVLAYAETVGFLTFNIDPPYEIASEITVIFGLAAIILALTTVGLSNALQRARRSEQSLTNSNRELQVLSKSLEQQTAERTRALDVSREVSRHLSTILDQQQLMAAVVEQVRSTFDYYYTQIYLFDETQENLVLAQGTGEAGRAMLERRHKLPRGRGLVGRAADTRDRVLVPDVRRSIGVEIITPENVAEVYRRETDPAYEAHWYADWISERFSEIQTARQLAGQSAETGKKIQLGYLLHVINDFTGVIRRGAEAAARELQVQLEITGPSHTQEYIPLFQALIAKKKDGLVAVPHDEQWPTIARQAIRAGIPVVAANIESEPGTALANVFQNNFQSGSILARELTRLLVAAGKSEGRIILGPSLPDRIKGFLHGMRQANYTIIQIDEPDYLADGAAAIYWRQAIEAYPDLIAAVGLLSFDIPVLADLKRASMSAADWLIAGYDLDLSTIEAIKSGLAQVTIGQHPYLQGYLPVLALAEHLRRGVRLEGWLAEGWLPNPLLPETKTEMAVPIVIGEQVLGVLDVQHNIAGNLRPEEADLLQSVADQVAVALQNARLFEEVETALAEARAAQARYVEQSWQQVRERKVVGQYHYARPEAAPLNDTTVTAAKRLALSQDQPAVIAIADQPATSTQAQVETGQTRRAGVENPQGRCPKSIVAPIKVSDQPIGTLQLHPLGPDQSWSEDDLAVVEAVVDQLAQSAESLRLFEETRSRAGREATIREITDKLRAAPNLNTLVDVAARELGEQLGVPHLMFELGRETESSPQPALSGNGI